MKKNLKIVAAIQARMGSTRLPEKVIRNIAGKTPIEWIKYRLSFAKELDNVVLSTSTLKSNDRLVTLSRRIGLSYYRGSEKDLIQRLLGTCKKFGADAIVRVTGDCPLVDPALVDKLVRIFKKKYPNIDYVCNISPPSYPDGMDIEVLSLKTLNRLDKEIKDPMRREWLTTNILENTAKYGIYNVKNKTDLSHLRLTLDYLEDEKLIALLFKHLHKKGKIFHLKNILELLQKEPSFGSINKKWVDMTVINNFRSHAFHALKKNNNEHKKK